VSVAVAIATVASSHVIGRSHGLTIAFIFINAGEALLSAWLVGRWFGGAFKLEDVRQVLGFLIASTVAAATGAAGAAIAIGC
jgi:integral membrane sensor domain MASE1